MREMPEIDAIRRSETIRMARECANLHQWDQVRPDRTPAYFWLIYMAIVGALVLLVAL